MRTRDEDFPQTEEPEELCGVGQRSSRGLTARKKRQGMPAQIARFSRAGVMALPEAVSLRKFSGEVRPALQRSLNRHSQIRVR